MQCICIAFINWLVRPLLFVASWCLEPSNALLTLQLFTQCAIVKLQSPCGAVGLGSILFFSCLMACWDLLSNLPESWKEAFGVFGIQRYLLTLELQVGEHPTHRSVWEHRVHFFPRSPTLSFSVPVSQAVWKGLCSWSPLAHHIPKVYSGCSAPARASVRQATNHCFPVLHHCKCPSKGHIFMKAEHCV